MGDHQTRRAMAALDEMAEAWAKGANLTRAIAILVATDDRESRIEAFVKAAWTEGAFAALKRRTVTEIEEDARGGP